MTAPHVYQSEARLHQPGGLLRTLRPLKVYAGTTFKSEKEHCNGYAIIAGIDCHAGVIAIGHIFDSVAMSRRQKQSPGLTTHSSSVSWIRFLLTAILIQIGLTVNNKKHF